MKVILNSPLGPLGRCVWDRLERYYYPRGWIYNQQAVEIMSRVLVETSNCVDVGCHIGSVLRHMLNFAPQGNHFAFEPLPELAQVLRRNFPGVNVYEMALGEVKGESTFLHVVNCPGYSGFRRQRYPRPDASVEEIRVKIDTLDNMIPPDCKVDFIKVDVEGAELQVLRGGLRTIGRHKPFVVFEHGPASAGYGTTPEMLYQLFTRQCELKISILSDWLDKKPPLSQGEFVAQAERHSYFLAHP
jgi:FkbM family methyltransferase